MAFLDVLNFRGMINDTVDSVGNEDPGRIKAIYDAYETIEEIWSDWDGEFPTAPSKNVTIFSDTVVVSVKASDKRQIFYTLLQIKRLIMELLWKRILVRGAVVRGRLIHEREKIFGPALIEAYVMESKAALYPRVIIGRELVEAAEDAKRNRKPGAEDLGDVRSLLGQDSDGMFYVDYFYKAFDELYDPDFSFPAYVTTLADIIRKGLMGSVHPANADVRVKYFWMRERYNRMVETVTAPLKFRNWNEEEPTDLEAFYGGLKKISPGRSS